MPKGVNYLLQAAAAVFNEREREALKRLEGEGYRQLTTSPCVIAELKEDYA